MTGCPGRMARSSGGASTSFDFVGFVQELSGTLRGALAGKALDGRLLLVDVLHD